MLWVHLTWSRVRAQVIRIGLPSFMPCAQTDVKILSPALIFKCVSAFGALTLLIGWQEGHLTCKKTEWWGAGGVICLELGADLHMAQLMSLPLTVSFFGKIQIGFTFLVPAHPRSPRQRAVKRLCVCACACVCFNFHQQVDERHSTPFARWRYNIRRLHSNQLKCKFLL